VFGNFVITLILMFVPCLYGSLVSDPYNRYIQIVPLVSVPAPINLMFFSV
jgi:hypothetical protein